MIKQRDSKVRKGEKVNLQLGRKLYLKPKLIEYGQLEKLTQGGPTGKKPDGLGGRRPD